MDEKVSTKRVHGQCDICGVFGWVTLQLLGDMVVASQCKRCEKASDDDVND